MKPWLAAAASLRTTLALIVVLGLAVVLYYSALVKDSALLALPLALLAVNLAAALATRPAFRAQRALTLFHVGLIGLVLLLACGRLTYLRGTVEVSEGAWFDGELASREAGPWHAGRLAQLRFANDGFSIDYGVGVTRDRTRNALRYLDETGTLQHAEIGDQQPLVLSGYRFYTTPNKGFAPSFTWYPADGGAPVTGAVHLPSYPLHQYRQAREWQLPGTTSALWTMLSFDELILDPARPSAFRLPSRYKVVVRAGALRAELAPGQALELPEGRLVFDRLGTWMGYAVFYDWTIGPLLAVSLLSVLALLWHLAAKYRAKPWNGAPLNEETWTN